MINDFRFFDKNFIFKALKLWIIALARFRLVVSYFTK
jgi:hypothetical protein